MVQYTTLAYSNLPPTNPPEHIQKNKIKKRIKYFKSDTDEATRAHVPKNEDPNFIVV